MENIIYFLYLKTFMVTSLELHSILLKQIDSRILIYQIKAKLNYVKDFTAELKLIYDYI
jgi:hypothetical protein